MTIDIEMAKHRTVNTHFWDDAYIESLGPSEILLFLFLITNPQTNIAGVYEITVTRMHERTKLSKAKIMEILAKFERDDKFIYRDNLMLTVNAIKHQKTDVPTIKTGIETIVSQAPQWVKDRLGIVYEFLSHLILIPSYSIPSDVGKREETKPKKPVTLPTSVESEINSLLDAVAPLIGAKSRQTMANAKQWRDVCEIVVKEQRDVIAFLDVVKGEAHRNKAAPQFFTAQNCLKVFQTKAVKVNNGFVH